MFQISLWHWTRGNCCHYCRHKTQQKREHYTQSPHDDIVLAQVVRDRACHVRKMGGFGEEFCRDTVKQITSRLQCLKARKIKFGPFDSKRIYFGTVDCVHCDMNEFWTDPNSKWYSHKHNGAGVSFEVVIDICRDNILWKLVLNLQAHTTFLSFE